MKFRKSIERIGVWEWSRENTNDYMIMDDTSWSVEISYEGHSISTWGSNAYHGSDTQEYSRVFRQFIRALNKLVGVKGFVEEPEVK